MLSQAGGTNLYFKYRGSSSTNIFQHFTINAFCFLIFSGINLLVPELVILLSPKVNIYPLINHLVFLECPQIPGFLEAERRSHNLERWFCSEHSYLHAFAHPVLITRMSAPFSPNPPVALPVKVTLELQG